MTQPSSGPPTDDWLPALLRGLHPLRWSLCLAGLALTALAAAAARWLFDGQQPRWSDWWWQPAEQAQDLGAEVAGRSLGGVVLRLGPPLALTAAAWCLIGGWIARHELLARVRGRFGVGSLPPQPGPTALVVGRCKHLLLCCPTALGVVATLLLPVLVAGRLNAWFGAVGAVLVALLLPVLLAAS